MNQKIVQLLTSSVDWARSQGIRIINGGAWFEYDGDKVVAADPIGALLLRHLVPRPQDLSSPGFMKLACETLEVDEFWLRRFWMGYDRGWHVTLITKEDKKEIETKDEVSDFGIQFWKKIKRQANPNYGLSWDSPGKQAP